MMMYQLYAVSSAMQADIIIPVLKNYIVLDSYKLLFNLEQSIFVSVKLCNPWIAHESCNPWIHALIMSSTIHELFRSTVRV